MPGAAPTPAELALDRWLLALRGRGLLPPLQAALAPGFVVQRFGWDAQRGVLAERFEELPPLAAWCARSPAEVEFLLDGPVTPTDPGFQARYEVRLGDFHNGGTWRFDLAPDGRIAWLLHQPDDLPEAWRQGVPPGLQLPGFMPEQLERARREAIAQAEALRQGAHDHDRKR